MCAVATWGLAAVLLYLNGTARAADVALVIGVGVTSYPASGAGPEPVDGGNSGAGAEDADGFPRWRIVERRAARTDAEAAFRELAGVGPEVNLYAQSPYWEPGGSGGLDLAVLLTDGAADNNALPMLPALVQARQRVSENLDPQDTCVAFVAGMGRADGLGTWIHSRRHGKFYIGPLAKAMFNGPAAGTRALVVRLYPFEGDGDPVTLGVLDPSGVERLRDWVARTLDRIAAGQPVLPPGRILPGLGHRLVAASRLRLERLQQILDEPFDSEEGQILLPLDAAVQSRPQQTSVPVDLRVETIYHTSVERRPGPLFTIQEVEVRKPVGERTVFDGKKLTSDLVREKIAPVAAEQISAQVQDRADYSFTSTNQVLNTDYVLRFSREEKRLWVEYRD